MAAGTEKVKIRDAQHSDLEGIFRIYDYEVINTTATYETVPKTVSEREAWFRDAEENEYPILVAESEDGLIIGWSRLYAWSPRAAYRRTAECAVYVDARARGLGLGRLLLKELIRVGATSFGIKVIVSKTSNENEGSIRLQSSLGFKTVGIMERCAEKFGKLLDVRIMDLHLD